MLQVIQLTSRMDLNIIHIQTRATRSSPYGKVGHPPNHAAQIVGCSWRHSVLSWLCSGLLTFTPWMGVSYGERGGFRQLNHNPSTSFTKSFTHLFKGIIKLFECVCVAVMWTFRVTGPDLKYILAYEKCQPNILISTEMRCLNMKCKDKNCMFSVTSWFIVL